MSDDIFKMDMKAILKQIDEGCVGGSCSIGGAPSRKSGKNGGGGANTISSLNSTVGRLDSWQNPNKDDAPDDEKKNVYPEEPDTEYIDQEEGMPFTAEEKYVDDWTQKELKFESAVRTDDEWNKAQDLKERYNQMMAAMTEDAQAYPVEEPPQHPLNGVMDDPMDPTTQMMGMDGTAHQDASQLANMTLISDLENVTNHFDTEGKPYEVMVKVGETSKSVAEWNAEINRDSTEGLPPQVPSLPPTEGGYDGENSTDTNGTSDIPFPEFDTPNM